jgi:hypothetical protein
VDFNVYPVDEQAQMTEMMGASTQINQAASIRNSPSRSLVALWVAVLAFYWFLGWFFKGARKG